MGPETEELECPYCHRNAGGPFFANKILFANIKCEHCGADILIVQNEPRASAVRGGTIAAPHTELAARSAKLAGEMLNQGASGDKILVMLVNAAESIAGERSVCSILVLDSEGLLRNAMSPNLPADYLMAIDRLRPNPRVGTCAAAAATGCPVLTPDFYTDDKWAELRHLPMSLGFVGAWSMPIKATDGKVLGTLGTYFRQRRTPTPKEMESIHLLATAAAPVLARHYSHN